MVNSMTGYGRAQQLLGEREIGVEIKSVNHRYFEFSARVPRSYGYLEEKLKTLVHARVGRGKVDVFVSILALDGAAAQVEVNHTLAEGYLSALRGLGRELMLDDDITLSDMTRFSDIFTIRKSEADEDEVWKDVRAVADQALDAYLAMKGTEGQKLESDVRGRLDSLEGLVSQVEERSPQVAEQYRRRLYAKLQEVLGDTGIEEAACSPKPRSLPRKPRWTRKRCAFAATWIKCAAFCPREGRRLAVKWISLCRR